MTTDNTTNEAAPKLMAKGISKRFGNMEVLRNVDVTIFPGVVSAFVGPNGAGKTTLFHILSGNLKPDSGRVILDGKDITRLSPWKIARGKLGKLYQDVRIFEHMTTLENVQAALLSGKEYWLLSSFLSTAKHEKRRREEALHWLEYVGLAEYANKLGSELSFGQQKLLSIARIIACRSRLLLLDEPTAALSPVMIEKITKLIQKLVSEQNCSVALIEHNMNVVQELAFYTYFMYEGTVFRHGTQKCVLEDPEVRGLYMGLSGVNS